METESRKEELLRDTEAVTRSLIAVCQDNLYLSGEDRRYTTEELVTKIEVDLKQPGIASIVKDAIEEAETSEDKYLIAETVFSIVESIQTFQSPEYKKDEEKERPQETSK